MPFGRQNRNNRYRLDRRSDGAGGGGDDGEIASGSGDGIRVVRRSPIISPNRGGGAVGGGGNYYRGGGFYRGRGGGGIGKRGHQHNQGGGGGGGLLDARKVELITGQQYRTEEERWYKVTVVFGVKYERAWLLENLQARLSRSFTPFMWRTEQRNCFFYVREKKNTAAEYSKVASDIVAPDGRPVLINVSEAREPVVPVLDDDAKQALRSCLSRRYLQATRALDLSALRKDAELAGTGLYLPLNKPNVVNAVLELLSQIPNLELAVLNLSDNQLEGLAPFAPLFERLAPCLTTVDLRGNRLRSVEEIGPIKKCQELRSIRLEENPVVVRLSEVSSAIKAMCPKLEKINDREVAVSFGDQRAAVLPPSNLGYFPNDNIKQAVINYLKEYYAIFDSAERSKLLAYYTEHSTLTLSTAAPPSSMKHKPLGCYIGLSRNLMYLENNKNKADSLVQRGRLQCVSAVEKLPRTNHLLSSLRVDVPVNSDRAALIFLTGLFIELTPPQDGGERQDKTLRTFTRTLVLVPVPGSAAGMQIHSDDFYITHVSNQGANWFREQNAATAATAASAAVLQDLPAAAKDAMVADFAAKSGMNPHFSRQCLAEFGWNFDLAATNFVQLKAEGKLPAEAFAPAPM